MSGLPEICPKCQSADVEVNVCTMQIDLYTRMDTNRYCRGCGLYYKVESAQQPSVTVPIKAEFKTVEGVQELVKALAAPFEGKTLEYTGEQAMGIPVFRVVAKGVEKVTTVENITATEGVPTYSVIVDGRKNSLTLHDIEKALEKCKNISLPPGIEFVPPPPLPPYKPEEFFPDAGLDEVYKRFTCRPFDGIDRSVRPTTTVEKRMATPEELDDVEPHCEKCGVRNNAIRDYCLVLVRLYWSQIPCPVFQLCALCARRLGFPAKT